MEERTVIIAGHITLNPGQRQSVVDSFADLISRCRAYQGCLDVSVSPDPFDPTRLYMLEVWRSEADLQAWRKIANGPDIGVEFNDSQVFKYEISRTGPPF